MRFSSYTLDREFHNTDSNSNPQLSGVSGVFATNERAHLFTHSELLSINSETNDARGSSKMLRITLISPGALLSSSEWGRVPWEEMSASKGLVIYCEE